MGVSMWLYQLRIDLSAYRVSSSAGLKGADASTFIRMGDFLRILM